MMKTVKQQHTETMAGLKDAFRKRKEEQLASSPPPTTIVRDPGTGQEMTKAEYQAKYNQQ